MSILMPALGQAREQARRVVCLTNLKNLGTAIESYGSAYKDYWVAGGWQYEQGHYRAYPAFLAEDDYINAPSYMGSDRLDFGDSVPAEAQRTVLKCPESPPIVENNPNDGFFDPDSSQRVFGMKIFAAETPDEIGDIYSSYAYSGSNNIDQFPMVFNKGTDYQMKRMTEARSPSQLVLLYDGSWNHNAQWPDRIGANHMQAEQTATLLADGHAETFNRDELPMEALDKDYLEDESPYPKWRLDQ